MVNELVQIQVAGTTYIPDLVDCISKGQITDNQNVELVQEPHNQYDCYAVLCMVNGKKIGYIPRDHSQVIFNLLNVEQLNVWGQIWDIRQEGTYIKIVVNICLEIKK